MAMVDDPDWLLSHIRHSFITSDDTGMCEMVIQDNDLLTLDEHRKRLKERRSKSAASDKSSAVSNGKEPGTQLGNSVEGTSDDDQVIPLSPSPDITSGWDFGIRRRSNTAQKLERIRKERQNRVKIKTVHWKDLPERFMNEHLDLMFAKRNALPTAEDCSTGFDSDSRETIDGYISNNFAEELDAMKITEKSVPVIVSQSAFATGFNLNPEPDETEIKIPKRTPTVSVLSEQLSKSVNVVNNPFKDYSKFDGRGHEGSTHTQRINMFVYVYAEAPPIRPLQVVVLSAGAKIVDLIGLTCWQYVTNNLQPALKRSDVQGFSLNIAEDDGEVDYGFPALENNEPVSKFSFPTLALVEKHQVSEDASDEGKFRESVFVRVNDYAGFSLIQVEDLNVTMGEVLRKAIKRRKGNKYVGKYVLEYMDRPGVAVEEDQSLDSTSAIEFYMLREHSARSASSTIDQVKKSTPARVHFAN